MTVTKFQRREHDPQLKTWLRHLTTVLIVMILVVLAGLGVQRSRKLTRPVGDHLAPELLGGDGDQAIGVYTGFEYIESVAGKAIFALRSIRTLGKSSGWHDIEGVQLQLYEDGRPGPVVTADGASFNIQTRDARLRGPIHITFPDGATLSTDRGSFEAAARRFTSDSDVLFMSGDTVMHAGRVMYFVEDSRVVLENDAVLTSGGTSLLASKIDYLREQGTVLFPDGCRVIHGDGWMEAPEVTVNLVEPDGPPSRIELGGGVHIGHPGTPDGGSLQAWAQRVAATRDASGNWQVVATTTSDWISVTLGPGTGYFERTIKTRSLRGVVAPDGLRSLRASLGTCLSEVPLEGALRRAESWAARVWFAEGQATDIELDGDVKITGQGINARGSRARVVSEAGITMLYGDPTGLRRALVEADRGRITSDQVQFFDHEQRIEARGNVQGQLLGVAILGADGAGTKQPMHFAAGVLDITENGEHFRLREGARVWQGRRLLIADDLAYARGAEVVDASGHVRATFPADQLGSQPQSDDDVVVISRSLRYDRPARLAVFEGNVRYSDSEHVLSATELRANFDADSTITEIQATGDVIIEELTTGRTLHAQQATRDVVAGLIHATGSPVRLTDASGTTISSSSLTWTEADGSVAVAGGTETIYYPEEEP